MPEKRQQEKKKIMHRHICFVTESQETERGKETGSARPRLGAVRVHGTPDANAWSGFHGFCGAKTNYSSGTSREKNQVWDWASGCTLAQKETPNISTLTRYWQWFCGLGRGRFAFWPGLCALHFCKNLLTVHIHCKPLLHLTQESVSFRAKDDVYP